VLPHVSSLPAFTRVMLDAAGVAVNGDGNGNGTDAATTLATPTAQQQAPQPIIQQVNIPDPIPGMLPAPKIFAAAVAGGEAKAKSSAVQILIKGVLAGMYIAMGGAALLAVGGACPGALSRPRCILPLTSFLCAVAA
jgi:hypothetical protein